MIKAPTNVNDVIIACWCFSKLHLLTVKAWCYYLFSYRKHYNLIASSDRRRKWFIWKSSLWMTRCELFQMNSFSKPVQRVSIHTCWVRNILQLRNGVPQIMFDFQANMQNRIFNTTNILSLVSSISLKLMKNSLNFSVQISMKIHSSVVSPVSITDLL